MLTYARRVRHAQNQATFMIDIVAAISILVIAATIVAACLREEQRP